MVFLKRYYRLQANSILESVIALCIISACLYIAILVYANVFNSRTSAVFYHGRNEIQELFFLAQVMPDSIDLINTGYEIEEEWENENLKRIYIIPADSLDPAGGEFYIQQ